MANRQYENDFQLTFVEKDDFPPNPITILHHPKQALGSAFFRHPMEASAAAPFRHPKVCMKDALQPSQQMLTPS